MSLRTRFGAFACFTTMAVAISACALTNTATEDDVDNEDDGVRVCASGATLDGIDVSHHNGTIDWTEVKASGKVFAFARVSDGDGPTDKRFAENWQGIKDVGMVRGAYQFFRPGEDPIAQADLLLSEMGTLEPGDLPPVIDVETADRESKDSVAADVKAWIDHVEARTGQKPIVYAAAGFWDTLSNTSQFAGQPLWVANYTNKCPTMPKTWTNWEFWQFSESGNVPGITGHVDLNLFNGTLADLLAMTVAHPNTDPCATDADCDAPPDACEPLTFPSGVKIRTAQNQAMTDSYKDHLQAGEAAPTCFLDVDNLVDPDTKEKYDLTVKVAKNFQLDELVGAEVDQGYGSFVLLSPAAVASLQLLREAVGKPVTITSGFRGPKHQEDVCKSVCGEKSCPGQCEPSSRHIWGDAFDLPEALNTQAHAELACNAGFKHIHLEGGSDLHVDQDPAFKTCVQQ